MSEPGAVYPPMVDRLLRKAMARGFADDEKYSAAKPHLLNALETTRSTLAPSGPRSTLLFNLTIHKLFPKASLRNCEIL